MYVLSVHNVLDVKKREEFLSANSQRVGFHVQVHRDMVLADVIRVYSSSDVADYSSITVSFVDEEAIDEGGVTRDLYSAFWQAAYQEYFDGPNQLVPALHPSSKLSDFQVLGVILIHGYLISGVLPVKIAFPVLCQILLSPGAKIPAKVMIESFLDYLVPHEQIILSRALEASPHGVQYDPNTQSKLIEIVSRFECREIPTPKNMRTLLFELATYEFSVKPLAAINSMNSGMPEVLKRYFSCMVVEDVLDLYRRLTVSVETVLNLIREPTMDNKAQETTFRYLIQYVSSLQTENLARFLRFVTGSIVPTRQIEVSFCNLIGLGRRPMAHTCGYELVLSICYNSQQDFNNEFSRILQDDSCWTMDSF